MVEVAPLVLWPRYIGDRWRLDKIGGISSILLVLKKTTNEYYYDSSTKQIIIPPIFSPFEYNW